MKAIAYVVNVLFAIADKLHLYWLADHAFGVWLERYDRWYRDEPPAIVWRIL